MKCTDGMRQALCRFFVAILACLSVPCIAQNAQRFTPSGALKYMPMPEDWTSVRESPFGEVFQRAPKTPPLFAIAYVNEFDPKVDVNTDDLAADVRANIARYIQIPRAVIQRLDISENRARPYPCVKANSLLKVDGQEIRAGASIVEVRMRFVVCRDMRHKPRGFVVGVSHVDGQFSKEFESQVQDFLTAVHFRKD
jgi:hypothetical protein